MRMKDIFAKQASQNDWALQKVAADLTINYLAEVYQDLYPAVYQALKKTAMQKLAAEKVEKNKNDAKRNLILALLGSLGAGAGAGFAASALAPGKNVTNFVPVPYNEAHGTYGFPEASNPALDEAMLKSLLANTRLDNAGNIPGIEASNIAGLSQY